MTNRGWHETVRPTEIYKGVHTRVLYQKLRNTRLRGGPAVRQSNGGPRGATGNEGHTGGATCGAGVAQQGAMGVWGGAGGGGLPGALFWAPEKAGVRQPLLIFSLLLALGTPENAGVA